MLPQITLKKIVTLLFNTTENDGHFIWHGGVPWALMNKLYTALKAFRNELKRSQRTELWVRASPVSINAEITE